MVQRLNKTLVILLHQITNSQSGAPRDSSRTVDQDSIGLVLTESLLDEDIGLGEKVDHVLATIVLDLLKDHVHEAFIFEHGACVWGHGQDVRDAAPLQSLVAACCRIPRHVDPRENFVKVVLR